MIDLCIKLAAPIEAIRAPLGHKSMEFNFFMSQAPYNENQRDWT